MKEVNVSFIVPVYNTEKYLDRCLISILSQTYEEFEVICVNDGSSDKSLNILKKYQSRDERVNIINQINGGPSKARNNGLNNAKGKYIAFVDADDFIDKNYLNNMFSNSEYTDMSICNYMEINNTGKHNVEIFKFLKDEIVENNINIINEVITGPGGLVWGKLFNRDIIDINNIIFNEKFKMCEDLLFVTEFVVKATKIKKINKNLYIHNKCNDDSITANYNLDIFIQQLRIQEHIKSILQCTKGLNKNMEDMLNIRIKNILTYSIYKEIKSKKKLMIKLKNIKKYVSIDEIVKEKLKFKYNGPIDRELVKAIKKNRILKIYLLTKLREAILNIYNRVVFIRKEKDVA